MPGSQHIVAGLKRALKQSGLTYAEVGRQLDVSESSVKRWFAEEKLSLQRIDAVCHLLDIDYQDLLQLGQQEEGVLDQLTEDQEQQIVNDTRLLLVGYLLLQRWTPQQIIRRYEINEREMTQLLTRLDRLGIIELLPGNRVRTLVTPNFRWRTGGPIQRYFEASVRKDFFDSHFDLPGESQQFLYGMLSEDSIEQLNRRISHLVEDYRTLIRRDRMVPIAERSGTSLVIALRRWGFPAFDALKRPDGSKL